MARSKYKVVDMSELPSEETLAQQAKPSKLKFGAVDELPTDDVPMTDFFKDTLTPATEAAPVEQTSDDSTKPAQSATPKTPKHVRSKRYAQAHDRIDRTKLYSLPDALKLLKENAGTKFDESVEVHVVLREIIANLEVAYPHSTGKTIRVKIFNDDVLANLEKNIIDFDILLATPAQMGKLTKFARVLGPKGLMPNPKNGTLIADPEKRKKELESGKQTVKGEKKSPLMHAVVGKVSMDSKDLQDNIETLLKALTGKIFKLTICSTMSPGIKVIV